MSWSYGSWIYNYMCNHFLSPLILWVRTPYNIKWYNLSVSCDRSVVFPRYSSLDKYTKSDCDGMVQHIRIWRDKNKLTYKPICILYNREHLFLCSEWSIGFQVMIILNTASYLSMIQFRIKWNAKLQILFGTTRFTLSCISYVCNICNFVIHRSISICTLNDNPELDHGKIRCRVQNDHYLESNGSFSTELDLVLIPSEYIVE
jgi:hypothetical protein